jgi:hypothetical protein
LLSVLALVSDARTRPRDRFRSGDIRDIMRASMLVTDVASGVTCIAQRVSRTRRRLRRETSASATSRASHDGSRRAFLAQVVASASVTMFSAHPWPAVARDAGDVRTAVARVREARDQVAACLDVLVTADALGVDPPLKELDTRLSQLSSFERDAIAIDRFVAAAPLTDIESATWRVMKADQLGVPAADLDDAIAERGGTGAIQLPGVKRPNDFLCFVFSCYNDPRAPPSTEPLLTLRLARTGVSMGLRNDPRITSEGLRYSLTDVLEKFDAYLELVDGAMG